MDLQFQPAPGYGQALSSAPKRHNRLLAAVSIAAVVALGSIVTTTLEGGSSSTAASAAAAARASEAQASAIASIIQAAAGVTTESSAAVQVTVPASAGGLIQMTGSIGQRVTAAMKKADSPTSAFANADFAAYARSGSSSYFANLTLVPLDRVDGLEQQYQADGAAVTLSAAMNGADPSDSETVRASMPGGAMTCGLFSVEGVTTRDCAWLDASEFGIFAAPSSTDNAQASAYAEAIWTASESN